MDSFSFSLELKFHDWTGFDVEQLLLEDFLTEAIHDCFKLSRGCAVCADGSRQRGSLRVVVGANTV